MKFLNKKLLLISSSIVAIAPIASIISCSKNNDDEFNVSSNQEIYSTIWNLSTENIIKNSIFEWTVSKLEETINNNLKSDSNNNYMMKVYVFYLLWNGIKNPKKEDGTSQTNLSSDINSFSEFLSSKMTADDSSVSDDDKTFNNTKKYLNTFDYKISIINFNGGEIDKNETIGEIFSNDQYVLNFKIDFWTSDEETNKKMISSSGKSIMFKNILTRKQRETILNIKNKEIKTLVTNQFNYQSTKIYYDVENNQFSTIILPSNIYSGISIPEATPNSGFGSEDSKRQLFEFNWYSKSSSSTSFNTYMDVNLSNSSYFNISISSNWSLFLKWSGFIENSDDGTNQMKNIKINLKNTIYYNASDYE